MRLSALLFAALALAGLVSASAAATLDGLAVEVTNASEPVLCAEKDNVTINFASPEVRRFRIEATHPAYIGGLRQDASRAGLDRLRGHLGRNLGGSAAAQGHVLRGCRDVAHRLHLRQFLAPERRHVPGRRPGRDGACTSCSSGCGATSAPRRSWSSTRPTAIGASARCRRASRLERLGSSFLIGPVEMEGRPMVSIKDIAFDPKTMTFTLTFAQGGARDRQDRATRRREDCARRRARSARRRASPSRRCARCMSPSSTPTWRASPPASTAPRSWREEPIMGFKGARATDVWMGRLRALAAQHQRARHDLQPLPCEAGRDALRRRKTASTARPSISASPIPISAMPAKCFGSRTLAEQQGAEQDRAHRDQEGDEAGVRRPRRREEPEEQDVGEGGREQGERQDRQDRGDARGRQRSTAGRRKAQRAPEGSSMRRSGRRRSRRARGPSP